MSPRSSTALPATARDAGAYRASVAWRRRAIRGVRRLACGAALLCIALLSAGAGSLLALPGAGGAQHLAAQLEAQHHVTGGAIVPARLARSVIASEDAHFHDDVVVNVAVGAIRAARAWLGGQPNPGGATIDQQLAKALYGDGSGATGTLRQIGMGIKLGSRFSDRQILAMYLNVNYYGNGFWGVRQAAEGYFDVPPSQLTWGEASMLAGLLQAPSAYDPLTHRAAARARQAYVLHRLVADGVLSPRRAHEASRSAVPVR